MSQPTHTPSLQPSQTTPKPTPLEETLEDARLCINDEVRRYLQAHPDQVHQRDEFLSLAYEGFLAAYQGYNPHKGPFLRRVRACIRFGLVDEYRRQRKHQASRSGYSLWNMVPEPERCFCSGDLIKDLSDDAKTVVKLALDIKVERHRGRFLQDQLLGLLTGMGWYGRRIVESFQEIKRALSG